MYTLGVNAVKLFLKGIAKGDCDARLALGGEPR
jgi:hypothetical protein